MTKMSTTTAKPAPRDEASAAMAFRDRLGRVGPLAALALHLPGGWLFATFPFAFTFVVAIVNR